MKNNPRKTETSVVIVVIIFPQAKTLGPTSAFGEFFLEERDLLTRLDTSLRN